MRGCEETEPKSSQWYSDKKQWTPFEIQKIPFKGKKSSLLTVVKHWHFGGCGVSILADDRNPTGQGP